MPTQEEILEQSLRIIRPHLLPELGDRTLMDALNRLLAKHLAPPQSPPTNDHLDIRKEQITSRRDYWTTSEIKAYVRHERVKSKNWDVPIVVAIYQGEVRLLDGNNRINACVANSIERMHQVNIHEISGEGTVIQLPKLDF